MWKKLFGWIGKRLLEAALDELKQESPAKSDRVAATLGELRQKAERRKPYGKTVNPGI